MQFPDDQLAELKQLWPGVQYAEESGVPYFYIPTLQLPPVCTPAQVDALFCPTSFHGYTSRLFFSQVVKSPQSLNWNLNAHILGRSWHTYSWEIKNLPAAARLAQRLAVHLGAFR